MEVDKGILKNVAPEDIAEVLEAERETNALEEERKREYEAYLATLSRHQRHNLKRRAKKACEQAHDRAKAQNAVPPGVKRDNAEIHTMYELSVVMEKVRRIQHSVDHKIPLKGICRKTWIASGVRKQTVCGLHVPDNLEVVPLSFNRDIKKDWFGSDWPAWPISEDFELGFDIDDDGDDEPPF
ncbi:MAG: hypothetical protein ABJ246_08705 [Paracoccaceae bacterium]